MVFDSATVILLCTGLAAGLVIGVAVTALIWQRRNAELAQQNALLQSRIKGQEELESEREAAIDIAGQRLSSSLAQVTDRTLRSHSESFLKLAEQNLGKHHERAKGELTEKEQAIENLIRPIRESMTKAEQQMARIEKERQEAFGGIRAQLESMHTSQQALQSETRNLVTALRRPEVRGRWGEMTLRRAVELAGMVEYCDFFEQEHQATDEGSIRPDMIIRMPEQRELVVDVKTPLDAYLSALEASDENERKAAMLRHAQNVKNRIKELSSKAYWSQFTDSPEFVILFIPGDQFLAAALDIEPGLQEEAMRQKVLLTTPTHLVGLLKIVAYGWRQLALAKNAEIIRDLGEDLYKRLATFTAHLGKIGRQLGGSVDAFNQAVGSLERQVLPGARKFTELGIQPQKEVADLEPLDKIPRSIGPGEGEETAEE